MKIFPITERWNDGERDWSFVEDPRANIERWERANELSLPTAYRELMLKYNGGRVYPRQFRTRLSANVDSDSVEPGTTYLDAILPWKIVEAHWCGEIYGKGVPPNYLVFAKTPGPIQLLMKVAPPDKGRIVAWHHSSSFWGTEGNTKLDPLSNNLLEFLNSLIEDPKDAQYFSSRTYQRLARKLEL